LTDEEISWLRSAGADLSVVWEASTTSHRDRKQLLRCLIKEVVVTVDRERAVADLTVIWAGGASSKLTCKLNRTGQHTRVTSQEALDFVRQLAPQHSDEQIAFILNRKRLLTGQGNAFTPRRVAYYRERLDLPAPDAQARVVCGESGCMTTGDAAAALGVSEDTVGRWARDGFLPGHQVMPHAPWRVHITDEVRAKVVPDTPPDWLNLAEASDALGRSRQTILQWVKSGRLKAVQVTSGKRKGLRIKVNRQSVGLFAGR
jgi:transposase